MKRVMVDKELYMHLMNYCHNELKSTVTHYLKDSFKAYLILEPDEIPNGCFAAIDFSDNACYHWFILRWS